MGNGDVLFGRVIQLRTVEDMEEGGGRGRGQKTGKKWRRPLWTTPYDAIVASALLCTIIFVKFIS